MVIWGRGLIFRLTQANVHGEPNMGSRIKLNKTIITWVNFVIEKIGYKLTFKCGANRISLKCSEIWGHGSFAFSHPSLSPKIYSFKVTLIHIYDCILY